MPATASAATRLRKETPSIQSVDRSLLILETVGRSPSPVSLAQLTTVLKIDRSSVFRLANTLKRRGFLAYGPAGKDYVLGASIWRLSRQYDWNGMVAAVAHQHLQALARITGETTNLTIREGDKVLFIDHVATNQVVAISGQTGEVVPLHCTAHGKALLADFDDAALRKLLGKKPLGRHTRNTLTSFTQLAKNCAEIRTRGFAIDHSEYIEDVCCIAAPIRDRNGAIVASIGMSAPVARFRASRDSELAAYVVRAAATISSLI
ncbi:MAG TPA: IclR family transcriptional regulator [Bryobacteraceae bacterium]|jgi:IclR family acetate operon transcriptional repressor